MLFQMCYGPEIQVIYEYILQNPQARSQDMREYFQYKQSGDISSLLQAVLIFLEELDLISQANEGWQATTNHWDSLEVLQRIQNTPSRSDPQSYNTVFATLYDQLFVQPNILFQQDLHHETNRLFPHTTIGREKINAWKRIMETFGLGIRVYSGFYALPQPQLLQKILQRHGPFEGPLQIYCEQIIQSYLPCMRSGRIYDGVIFGLSDLQNQKLLQFQYKQDLPYPAYGKGNWNWMCYGEEPLRC